MNLNFNILQTWVGNIIWVLGLLGISLEISPVKINPFSWLVTMIMKPFKELLGTELQPVKD